MEKLIEKLLENRKRTVIITAIAILVIALFIHETNYRKPVNVVEQHIEGENLVVTLDGQGSCYLGDELNKDKSLWVKTDENNVCVIPINDYETNLYLRNSQDFDCGKIEGLELSFIEGITITSGDVYLAVGGKEKLTYERKYEGVISEEVVLKSGDESVATIDEDNVIHATGLGETTITATFGEKSDSINVLVTDLIVLAPREFDDYKPYLGCGVYTKEENDLLDKILASRVEKAGYHTRAGVVEAARFLALEFPYRINYFIENGRIASYVGRFVDGEGRYYHVGLYLDPSRYENLDPDMIYGGPGCWGCAINEFSKGRLSRNGLDCSGFVAWAILNGGFDCRDLGAGIAEEWPDLTDLGEKKVLSKELEEGNLRVGDLLSGPFGGTVYEGGHIAIVAGIDKDGYIYVAEELGYASAWGYFIKKYDANSILHYFYYRVDMENYYTDGDGNLTDFWIEGE